MDQPRIARYYLHWLHDFVRDRGQDPDLALGPLPDPAVQPFHSMTDWNQRLEQAANALDDPHLGLHFGCTITPQRFGVIGYLLHHCDTLGHAALRMHKYQRLLFLLQDTRLEQRGNGYRLGWRLGAGTGYQAEAFTVASVLQFARTLTGQSRLLDAVGLENAPPQGPDVLADFVACPVLYNQPMTSFTYSSAMLALPNVRPDAGLRAVLEEQANQLLALLPQKDDLILAVRRHIVGLLPEGEPVQRRVAERLNISTRTLHRHLAERNSRFIDLLEQVRRQLAESYLRDPDISLAEVALLLGYSEQSPFTHAFKRWTGQTPFDWRRQQLQGR